MKEVITIIGIEPNKVTWQVGLYGKQNFTFCKNYKDFRKQLKDAGYNNIIFTNDFGEIITASDLNYAIKAVTIWP